MAQKQSGQTWVIVDRHWTQKSMINLTQPPQRPLAQLPQQHLAQPPQPLSPLTEPPQRSLTEPPQRPQPAPRARTVPMPPPDSTAKAASHNARQATAKRAHSHSRPHTVRHTPSALPNCELSGDEFVRQLADENSRLETEILRLRHTLAALDAERAHSFSAQRFTQWEAEQWQAEQIGVPMHEALADLSTAGLRGRSQSVTSDEQTHEQTTSWFGSLGMDGLLGCCGARDPFSDRSPSPAFSKGARRPVSASPTEVAGRHRSPLDRASVY